MASSWKRASKTAAVPMTAAIANGSRSCQREGLPDALLHLRGEWEARQRVSARWPSARAPLWPGDWLGDRAALMSHKHLAT